MHTLDAEPGSSHRISTGRVGGVRWSAPPPALLWSRSSMIMKTGVLWPSCGERSMTLNRIIYEADTMAGGLIRFMSLMEGQ